jgi:hypothetical protein
MSATKSQFELAEDRETLIIRLAGMADTVRTATAAGAAMPVRCLLDCDPRHWTPWGRSDICCNCGTRPLPADQWHRLLVAALRASTPWLERRAA